MKYLVIGAGVAGVSAVKELIKRRQEADQIIIITDEEYPFYYRPRLIEYLSGEVSIDDIIINDQDWFAENDVDLKMGVKAKEIDTGAKRVFTTAGEMDYDKLLLANGAHSFLPPIEGSEREHIYTLRNAADAKAIYERAAESKKAVVVGCGLLGIESGFNLNQAGLKVTLLERSGYLLSRQLDKRAATLLQSKLEDRGLDFSLNADTERFEEEDGCLKVVLEDGRSLEADLVLVSTGVRSNTDLAVETDVEIKRAVAVNKKMETSARDVYAAGDIAECEGKFYGIWPPAMQQGQIAGKNMAGAGEEFTDYIPSHKLKVAGIDVISTGELDFDGDYSHEVEETENSYKKVVLDKDNNPIGAIIVGEVPDKDKILSQIK